MGYTAAAMAGAAALDGCVEGFLPGDPPFSLVPVVGAALVFVVLAAGWRWIPRRAWGFVGPLGVALVAYSLATTPGPIDGAVLYSLPVVWTSLFFGRRGAVSIVVLVGIAHAGALLALPAWSTYPGRWIDVMVSVSAVAAVVTALEERNAALVTRLTGEARTDALTGLLNRRGLDDWARPALAAAGGRSVSLVAFDVDHFKSVNDRWGHDAGDRVLAIVGDVLRTHARDGDAMCRLGGEEFAALLPGTDTAGAQALAARVRAAVATGCTVPTGCIRISAGIATGTGADSLGGLLERADAALYAAKRSGRDRVVIDGRSPAIAVSAG